MGKPIHASGDVQKRVHEADKLNEHNCIVGGSIPTTTCNRGM